MKRIMVVGPLPPPLNGMTVMTALALELVQDATLEIVHTDISDHRRIGNVGRLDSRNVYLALRHAIAFWNTARKHKPTLIYLPIAQGTLGFLRDALFFAIAASRRIPIVVHLHGAYFSVFYDKSNRLMKKIIRWCLRRAVTAIVLGPSLRGVFGNLIEDHRVVEVPNGLPRAPRFRVRSRSGSSVRILYLSNLTVGKGCRDVIDASEIVIRGNSKVEFLIAGDWARRSDERDAIAKVALCRHQNHVRFYRSVSGLRKAELFRSADLFVFPPRQLEGQPLVILEAMSYGLPVVTTPRGGIVDLVVDWETGMIVPPGDPDALSIAISTLAQDSDLRTRMGASGLARFENMFHERLFGERLGGILRRSANVNPRVEELSQGAA